MASGVVEKVLTTGGVGSRSSCRTSLSFRVGLMCFQTSLWLAFVSMTANQRGQSAWAFSNTTLLSTDEDMVENCAGSNAGIACCLLNHEKGGLRPIEAEWARDQSMNGSS